MYGKADEQLARIVGTDLYFICTCIVCQDVDHTYVVVYGILMYTHVLANYSKSFLHTHMSGILMYWLIVCRPYLCVVYRDVVYLRCSKLKTYALSIHTRPRMEKSHSDRPRTADMW